VRTIFGGIVGLGLLGAILVGCGGEGDVGQPGIVGVALNSIAPDITGTDADGKPMRLSEFRGKVVALDFWASW
jgi:cytochrome oxidase Cu insertion factor (SCO1/SenC/PrrC family)